ncbi:uncharacterized protein [Branchiostoma lanceolatum]|uniref:uncharacterized protein isoform X2 n=1 Tax=Branchiostoma lanceolatum TaxID=7740 RepID=UPI003451D584
MDRLFDRDELLQMYWYRGYLYSEISHLLSSLHGIELNERQLKHRFKQMGLSRRNNTASDDVVREAIREELQGPNQNVGYRKMWRCLLREYRLNVRRSTVQRILQEEDPEGSAQRRQRRLIRRDYFSLGPSQVWHIDGNDKLKPYGFCIHGCIDGYSRRCMWLHVGTTNKDAAVVATLYLNTVNQLEGCPQLVRSDPGTENVVVAAMQCSFHCNHQYGKSVHNQRIEAFWSHLRPTVVWWIGVFQEMAAHGDLEVGNFLHKGILRFCFMPIIRQQLLEFMEDWNDRRIRPHRGATVPGGRPNVLFFLPERTGGDNFLNHLSQHDRQQAQHYCKPLGNDVGNEPLNRYLEEMMGNMQRRVPDTWQEAAQLYIDLVHIASDP